ncbi:MAG: hypothetical protein JWN59_438 [Sphingomonas bacterium]|nr:hypothetical protein [Sphingomonas bacterium]
MPRLPAGYMMGPNGQAVRIPGLPPGKGWSSRDSAIYDVWQDSETPKNAGALTRILEMAKQNGGKNPLTQLSNSDFQALASSLSNLDTSQSDGPYRATSSA